MGTILAKIEDLWLGLRNFVSRGYNGSENASTSEADPLQKQTAQFTRLSDYVYALLPEENPEAVIVFFHGLLVDESEQKHAFWSTWKMRHNNDCWPITLLPEYLKSERKEGSDPYRIRVLAVSYEGRTSIPGKSIDEFLTAEAFIKDLVLTKFCRGRGDGNVPIFLVGHDLGGILIKKFIMAVDSEAGVEDERSEKKEKLERFLVNLKAVMFYATPHSGSQAIQVKAMAIPVDTRNPMLKLMSVLGPDMARINSDFTKCKYRKEKGGFKTYAVVPMCNTNQVLLEVLPKKIAFYVQMNETEKGFRNEMVVMEASARNDVDDYYSVDADHFQACQPQGIFSNNMTNLGLKIHDEISKIRAREETFERLKNSRLNQANNSGMVRLRQGIPPLTDPNILS